MQVHFEQSFLRDLKKLRSRAILSKVKQIIIQLEKARTLNEVKNLEPIKSVKHHFRIRINHFRLGLRINGGTIELVRILDRKNIYKYFP